MYGGYSLNKVYSNLAADSILVSIWVRDWGKMAPAGLNALTRVGKVMLNWILKIR